MDYLVFFTFAVTAFLFLYSMSKWSMPFFSSELKTRNAVNSYQYDILPEIKEVYDDWHRCMSSTLLPLSTDKLWSSFSKAVKSCRKKTAMSKLFLTNVKGGQETKYHIYNETDKTPSVVITLGVGWDAIAEEKLRKRLPNGSIFFGADPIYEINDQVYSVVGTFFPVAVGNETKVTKAYVMPKELKGKYVHREMVHIDVITFLTKFTHTPFIDQFLIDNEGPEYDIIPMMGVGAEFDQNGLVACQINTEFHAFNTFKKRFSFLLKKLLSDRRYAILKAHPAKNYRTFLLNFGHRKCVEKYIAQFLS